MPHKSQQMLQVQTANLWSSIIASFLFRLSSRDSRVDMGDKS